MELAGWVNVAAMDNNLSSADIALLQLLINAGSHTFPLVTDEADNRATLHAEKLVSLGLVERVTALPNTGTTYHITLKGRFAFDRISSIG